MAYFTDSDSLKILKYLELPISNLSLLQAKQQFIYSYFGDAVVDEVALILEELDALDLQSASYGIDANAGLKKASSLEWFPNSEGRTGMLNARVQQLKDRLATTFDMNTNKGYQGTPLLRS